MINNCIVITNKVKSIAKDIEESPEVTSILISLWMEDNNKNSFEDFPSAKELLKFKNTIREVNKVTENVKQTPRTLNFKDLTYNKMSEYVTKAYTDFESQLDLKYAVKDVKEFITKILDSYKEHIISYYESQIETNPDLQDYYTSVIEKLNYKDVVNAYSFDLILNQAFINLNSMYQKVRKPEVKEYLSKILDNYEYLVIYSLNELKRTHDLNIQSISLLQGEIKDHSNTSQDVSDEADGYDIDPEEQPKTGFSVTEVPNYSKISITTRNLLSNLEIRRNGKPIKTKLGTVITLEPEIAHKILIRNIEKITKSEDFIPLLKKLSKEYTWVNQLLTVFKDRPELASVFYYDLKKDFILYSIQYTDADGTKKYKFLNSFNKSDTLQKTWRTLIENNMINSKFSIIGINGILNVNNLHTLFNTIDTLQKNLNNSSLDGIEKYKDYINSKEFNKNLKLVLSSIAVNIESDVLDKIKNAPEYSGIRPIEEVVTVLYNLLNALNLNPNKHKLAASMLYTTYGNYFKQLSDIIYKYKENAVEDSATNKGKSIYSFKNPSYITTVLKSLKNKDLSEEEFQSYLRENYGKTFWFYSVSEGRYLNGILDALSKHSDIRGNIEYKELKYSDNKEPEEWSLIEGILNAYREYKGFGDNKNSRFTWYSLPTMSDKGKCAFIKFLKFSNEEVLRKYYGDRKYNNYEEAISDLLVDVALQEFNRIQTVKGRKNLIKEGKSKAIDNYDEERGEQFCFLPFLNSVINNYRDFIEDNSENISENQYSTYPSQPSYKTIVENEDKVLYVVPGKKVSNTIYFITNTNNDSDFNYFKEVNTEILDNLSKDSRKVLFPKSIGTTLNTAMPQEYATWLSTEIANRFNLNASIKKVGEDRYSISIQNKVELKAKKEKSKEGQDKSFIDNVTDLVKLEDGEKVRSYIRNAIKENMEKGFEHTFQEYINKGLLQSDPAYPEVSLYFNEPSLRRYYTQTFTKVQNIIKILDKVDYPKQSELYSNLIRIAKNLRLGRNIEESLKQETAYALREVLMQHKGESIETQVYDYSTLKYKTSAVTIDNSYIADLTTSLARTPSVKQELKEYFYNSYYMYSQLYQLGIVDLAYTRDLPDAQKRFYAIASATNKLFNDIEIDGTKQLVQRGIYLQDVIDITTSWDNTSAYLNESEQLGILKGNKKRETMSKLSESNATDGQAIRTLDSYRRIMIMSHSDTWYSKGCEQAYQNIKNKKGTIDDAETIFSTIKPLLFTQEFIEAGLDGDFLKVPIMYKDSEFVLFDSELYDRSPVLKALLRFAEAKNIDLFLFSSAVKLGNQGTININYKDSITLQKEVKKGDEIEIVEETLRYEDVKKDLTDKINRGEITREEAAERISVFKLTEEEVYKKLMEAVTLENGEDNMEVIHETNINNWGEQQANPQHFLDTTIHGGTQFKKLIGINISDDADLNVAGNIMKARNAKLLRNRIYIYNTLLAFEEVKEIFNNNAKLSNYILNNLNASDRYSLGEKYSYLLDNNGNFTLPLWSPTIANLSFNVLSNLLKKKVLNQEVAGSSLVQTSGFGFNENLQIVFKNNKGEEITYSYFKKNINNNGTHEDFRNWASEQRKQGNLELSHVEALAPMSSKKYFKPFMREDGTIDYDRALEELPEELKIMIGYRIPTEEKSSMIPIKIKGFTPIQSGGIIMLPADITVLSDSDFDIDKLYLKSYRFRIIEQIKERKALSDFKKEVRLKFIEKYHGVKGIELGDIQNEISKYIESEEGKKDFEQFIRDNIEKYSTYKFKKIKYDYDKDIDENTLDQRNNALLDIEWGMLTSKEGATSFLTPGGFDLKKRNSYIVRIAGSDNIDKICKDLGITSYEELLSILENMPLKELKKLADTEDFDSLHPCSPLTQANLLYKNSVGKQLVGVNAANSAANAAIQNVGLELDIPVSLDTSKEDGGIKKVLSKVKNEKGEYISKVCAASIGAAADNAKEPVLADLNENKFTSSYRGLLEMAGFDPETVNLFLAQPIIKEVSNILVNSTKYLEVTEVIKKVRQSYLNKYKEHKFDYRNYSKIKDSASFNKNQYFINIINENKLDTLKEKDIIKHIQNQLYVLALFETLVKPVGKMRDANKYFRADSPNSIIQTTPAKTLRNIQKILSAFHRGQFENNSILGLEKLHVSYNLNDINLKEHGKKVTDTIIHNSKTPYSEVFFNVLADSGVPLLGDKLLAFSNYFRSITDWISNGAIRDLTEDEYNTILKEFVTYKLSKLEFNKEGKFKFISEYKNKYLLLFPKRFAKIKSDNPELNNIKLIADIEYTIAEDLKIPILQFSIEDKINSTTKEEYNSDWFYLWKSENPEYRELAENLIIYEYFRSGFNFKPNSYGVTIPNLILSEFSNYADILKEMDAIKNNEELSQEDFNDIATFADLYIRHHLDDTNFVRILSAKNYKSLYHTKEDDPSYMKPRDKIIISLPTEEVNNSSFPWYGKVGSGENAAYYTLKDLRFNEQEALSYAIYERILPLGSKYFHDYANPDSKFTTIQEEIDTEEGKKETVYRIKQYTDKKEMLGYTEEELKNDEKLIDETILYVENINMNKDPEKALSKQITEESSQDIEPNEDYTVDDKSICGRKK